MRRDHAEPLEKTNVLGRSFEAEVFVSTGGGDAPPWRPLDQPALEYKFSHQIEGQPYIARGVTFMIDGGHMRLSMQHPASDSRE